MTCVCCAQHHTLLRLDHGFQRCREYNPRVTTRPIARSFCLAFLTDTLLPSFCCHIVFYRECRHCVADARCNDVAVASSMCNRRTGTQPPVCDFVGSLFALSFSVL